MILCFKKEFFQQEGKLIGDLNFFFFLKALYAVGNEQSYLSESNFLFLKDWIPKFPSFRFTAEEIHGVYRYRSCSQFHYLRL